VRRGVIGASGAERLCALGAIGRRFWPAPQLHRWTAAGSDSVVSYRSRGVSAFVPRCGRAVKRHLAIEGF
jgi:hypothetical protein